MRSSLLRVILVAALCATIVSVAEAAEVINLRVGQSGDKSFATYDLAGKVGEREAEVTVSLIINGEKYAADRLTLSGDFGKKVKTGLGKRIVWDVLADIATGFDGEVIWNVDSPATAPSPAAVSAPPLPTAAPPVAAPDKPVSPAAVADKPVPVASVPDTGAARPAPGKHPFVFGETTVRDRNTGLIWLKEVSKDGTGMDFGKARSAADRLSQERFAGCSSWRLPLEGELQEMVSYATAAGYTGKRSKGYPADYFNTLGFSGVSNNYYWVPYNPRVSPGLYNVGTAVDFEDGIVAGKPNSDHLQFWPVCPGNNDGDAIGENPPGRQETVPVEFKPGPKESPFEFNPLVARDKNTGLLWLREVSKDGKGMDFNRARGITVGLAQERFAGCRNWQLPQPEDIQKTLAYAITANYKGKRSNGYPADYFNSVGFSGVANDYYWTDFADMQVGVYNLHRVAIDLEDGLATSKPVTDFLQYWPVCRP